MHAGTASNVFEKDRWYLRPRIRSGSPEPPNIKNRCLRGLAELHAVRRDDLVPRHGTYFMHERLEDELVKKSRGAVDLKPPGLVPPHYV